MNLSVWHGDNLKVLLIIIEVSLINLASTLVRVYEVDTYIAYPWNIFLVERSG